MDFWDMPWEVPVKGLSANLVRTPFGVRCSQICCGEVVEPTKSKSQRLGEKGMSICKLLVKTVWKLTPPKKQFSNEAI